VKETTQGKHSIYVLLINCQVMVQSR